MGSHIELNDTLQITTEQGFPSELDLDVHQKTPFTAEQFAGKVFEFTKPDIRIYHPAPTRVFLVHTIDGKWLYWGHVEITEQTIHADDLCTTGKFVITKIYSPEHQQSMSTYETPEGKSYFS